MAYIHMLNVEEGRLDVHFSFDRHPKLAEMEQLHLGSSHVLSEIDTNCSFYWRRFTVSRIANFQSVHKKIEIMKHET